MAFTRHSLVLALFCGIASASWGPSQLHGDVDDSKGDFVDLEVHWKAGGCPFANFKLYTQLPGQKKNEEKSTSATQVTVTNKEFWSNYTIILETWYCIVEDPLISEIYTGPGNPHKVISVKTASTAVDANFTIAEAFMPRPVDQYNATWCSNQGCRTKIFARNNHGPPGTFDVKLEELSPKTPYNLTVVPEISFQGKVYRGSEFLTKFVTADVQLPMPTEINATFPWSETDLQGVRLTWKLVDTAYELAYYNVTLTSETDASFVKSQNVTKPEALFVDMPNSAKLTARITPMFNISNQMLHRGSGVTTFDTPHTDPRPSNFTYVGLNPTMIHAQWSISANLLPNTVDFNFTYTDPKNVSKTLLVPNSSILLKGLETNTTYEVIIRVVSKDMGSNLLTDSFTTLEEDYAAPADVKATLLSQIPTDASYNVTWTSDPVPEKASSFQIDSCNLQTKACTRNETKDAQLILPFGYFASYDLTVSAVYTLKLNQTQVRPAQKITLQTPGVEPLEVTNITLQDVTATDAVLVWTAPANLPAGLSKNYKISDAENNLINQTETERIEMSKLSPYNMYNIKIQASVRYNNTDYTGNQTSFRFYTDAAAPGAPETVALEQSVRSNIFKVLWTEPKVRNGMLDYYEVVTKDAAGNVVSNLTNLVGTNGATVTLASAHGDTNYTVSVRAVNVDLKNQALAGNATESILLFKGIDAPTAEVIKRSSDSLTFKVAPSNETKDTTGLFFTLKNANTSVSSLSDQIEVKNLSPYTNETVHVHACYLPTFCSEAFTVIELTNVGGPTPVNGLKGDFVNKTVPFINWTAPTQPNGPLDGYLLNLRDLTNSSLNIDEVLPANQTSYVYETTMEFERYNFTVSGFNYDLDDEKVRVVGELSSHLVSTTGDHPPKPDNVHEVNKTSTSASFQWEKPNFPGFNIAYFFIEAPSLKIKELTNETTFTLHGLKPWTNTTVLTRGCTSDNFTTCGFPGSYDISTAVDKPSEPLSITFTNVTETEVAVSWSAPSTPNGPITGYKIAVSVSDNQNLTWNEVDEKAAAHKLSNLTADTKYTVHLLAYNIDDDTGDELPSPPSTADFTTASTGGFAWWIIAVALIVIAAGAAIGVVLYRRRKAQGDDREQLVQA